MCSSPPHKQTHTPLQSSFPPVLCFILGKLFHSSRVQHRAVRQPHSSYLKTLLYFTLAGFYLKVIKESSFLRLQQTQSSSSCFPLGNKIDLCYCSVDCASRRQKGYRHSFQERKTSKEIKMAFFFFFLQIWHF